MFSKVKDDDYDGILLKLSLVCALSIDSLDWTLLNEPRGGVKPPLRQIEHWSGVKAVSIIRVKFNVKLQQTYSMYFLYVTVCDYCGGQKTRLMHCNISVERDITITNFLRDFPSITQCSHVGNFMPMYHNFLLSSTFCHPRFYGHFSMQAQDGLLSICGNWVFSGEAAFWAECHHRSYGIRIIGSSPTMWEGASDKTPFICVTVVSCI